MVQFAVAAVSDRRKLLKNKIRRSETAATAAKMHHYRGVHHLRRAVAGYNENNPRQTEFFHYDGLGSMVMQTNQTGGVEEQQVFYPLGPVWLASGGDHAGMCLAGELGCNVRPIRSIASQIAAFRMNQFHTLPVARFSALSSVMPTSMPITSGLTQPVFGLKASVNP